MGERAEYGKLAKAQDLLRACKKKKKFHNPSHALPRTQQKRFRYRKEKLNMRADH
jgi:hypothetical protein